MFVLRFKEGTTVLTYRGLERVHVHVGGEYIRHTNAGGDQMDGSTCSTTKDLQRAKVYNTASGAKLNWEAKKCDVVEVKVELA